MGFLIGRFVKRTIESGPTISRSDDRKLRRVVTEPLLRRVATASPIRVSILLRFFKDNDKGRTMMDDTANAEDT